jgi:hypothetical protein
MYPDKAVALSKVPRYAEVIKNGIGYYFYDPAEASTDRVVYE